MSQIIGPQFRASEDPRSHKHCPRCGTQIEPKDYKWVDWEHLECPKCGVRFIPGLATDLES